MNNYLNGKCDGNLCPYKAKAKQNIESARNVLSGSGGASMATATANRISSCASCASCVIIISIVVDAMRLSGNTLTCQCLIFTVLIVKVCARDGKTMNHNRRTHSSQTTTEIAPCVFSSSIFFFHFCFYTFCVFIPFTAADKVDGARCVCACIQDCLAYMALFHFTFFSLFFLLVLFIYINVFNIVVVCGIYPVCAHHGVEQSRAEPSIFLKYLHRYTIYILMVVVQNVLQKQEHARALNSPIHAECVCVHTHISLVCAGAGVYQNSPWLWASHMDFMCQTEYRIYKISVCYYIYVNVQCYSSFSANNKRTRRHEATADTHTLTPGDFSVVVAVVVVAAVFFLDPFANALLEFLLFGVVLVCYALPSVSRILCHRCLHTTTHTLFASDSVSTYFIEIYIHISSGCVHCIPFHGGAADMFSTTKFCESSSHDGVSIAWRKKNATPPSKSRQQ